MKEFIKELVQATIMATLVGGPFFYYMLFVLKA